MIKYDKKAMALYIEIGDTRRGKDGYCEELVKDIVIIDKNKDGVITGIEVLDIENIEDLLRRQ